MRNRQILIAATVSLAISGCGSENSGTFTTEDGETGEYTVEDNGETASMTIETADGDVTMRTGSTVDVDLPAGFSLIDGAEVLSNTVIDQGNSKGALLTFTSDKTPEAIAEFYRKQAEAADIFISVDASINEGKMLSGEDDSGTTFSITAYPGDDGTTGQLTISQEPG